jgi:hypothetical protein
VSEELEEIGVIVEAEEVEEPGSELVPAPVVSATLWRSDDPVEVIERSARAATALAEVVKKQKLYKRIGDKDHVLVEGWTMLGSMLGVFPVVVWTREIGNDEGWEARVEARTREGQVVGAAEAECRRSERMWAKRDSYALRSMSQTRATSKALRGPLGFVVTLAGFEATPEAEIPPDEELRHDGKKPPTIAQSNREWLQRMEALEVRKPEEWARAAAAASGVTRSELLQRLNRVLLDLSDGEHAYDPFMPDPIGTLQAAFAVAFDGMMIEPPPLDEVPDSPPGRQDPHAGEEGA